MWSSIRQLSDGEISSYVEAHQHLLEFEKSRRILPLVYRNETEFKAELDRLLNDEHGLAKPSATVEDESVAHEALNELNRRLVNYLTSFLVYLDHTRTRLTRRYGRESSELAAFDRWKGLADKNEFGYRFVRSLRNYVQHCGMPITHLTIKWLRDEPLNPNSAITSSLELGFNSLTLLEGTSRWGSAKPDLKLIGGLFDCWEPVHTATSALRQIDRNVVKAEYPKLAESYATIRAVVEDALALGQSPSVGTFAKPITKGGLQEMGGTVYNFPWRILRDLGFIQRAGDRYHFL